MISLTNYDFQWARSELVIIYPDIHRYNSRQGAKRAAASLASWVETTRFGNGLGPAYQNRKPWEIVI